MIAIFMCYIQLRSPCNCASNPIYFIEFIIASIFFFVLWFYHFFKFLIINMSFGIAEKNHPWCYGIVIHCKWHYMQLSIKWIAIHCCGIKTQFFICFTKFILFEIFIIKKWCIQIKLLHVQQKSGIKSDSIFVFPMYFYI